MSLLVYIYIFLLVSRPTEEVQSVYSLNALAEKQTFNCFLKPVELFSLLTGLRSDCLVFN